MPRTAPVHFGLARDTVRGLSRWASRAPTTPEPDQPMLTRNSSASPRPLPGACLGALLALCACNTPQSTPEQPTAKTAEPTAPPSASGEAGRTQGALLMSELSATAKVVSVDAATRLIALRREDGGLLQVKAGPEVRNFGQIAAGDTLRVQYRETLAASLRPQGAAKSAEAA